MKKVICLMLCAVMLLALCGCGYNKAGRDERQGNDERLTVIYNDGYCVIYRDNETGVQYFTRPNAGSCVLVNADGTPYTGEG